MRETRLRVEVLELGAGRVVEQLADPMPREDVTNFCASCAANGICLGPDGWEVCPTCSGWGRR